ncbi:MAG: hypothetical protein FVQ82_09705 [Planctomycetes bacterium]|nr:hypothetical protein [Planctomycetota bacterium]
MKKFIVCVILCSLITASVWATPTGLNNIPTADVVFERVLVFQYFNNMAKNSKTEHFTGFKYGLMKNVEVGLDGRIFPEKSSHENLVGQAKMRFELSDGLALALGVSNLGDRDKAGSESPYSVLSYSTSFCRLHFGGTTQNDNEGFFAGIDKTFTLLDRDFTLRSDIIQTNDQRDTTTSAGFIYDLGSNFLLESWMSFPSESGKEDVFTLKLNYVIKF